MLFSLQLINTAIDSLGLAGAEKGPSSEFFSSPAERQACFQKKVQVTPHQANLSFLGEDQNSECFCRNTVFLLRSTPDEALPIPHQRKSSAIWGLWFSARLPVTPVRGTLCRAHLLQLAQDLGSLKGCKEVCFVLTVSRRQISLPTKNKKSQGAVPGGEGGQAD